MTIIIGILLLFIVIPVIIGGMMGSRGQTRKIGQTIFFLYRKIWSIFLVLIVLAIVLGFLGL